MWANCLEVSLRWFGWGSSSSYPIHTDPVPKWKANSWFKWTYCGHFNLDNNTKNFPRLLLVPMASDPHTVHALALCGFQTRNTLCGLHGWQCSFCRPILWFLWNSRPHVHFAVHAVYRATVCLYSHLSRGLQVRESPFSQQIYSFISYFLVAKNHTEFCKIIYDYVKPFFPPILLFMA